MNLGFNILLVDTGCIGFPVAPVLSPITVLDSAEVIIFTVSGEDVVGEVLVRWAYGVVQTVHRAFSYPVSRTVFRVWVGKKDLFFASWEKKRFLICSGSFYVCS